MGSSTHKKEKVDKEISWKFQRVKSERTGHPTFPFFTISSPPNFLREYLAACVELQPNTMSFVPDAHILQGVVSIEEHNGVIKTVTGRYLTKKDGLVANIVLPLETYLTNRGATGSLEIFRTHKSMGLPYHVSSEDESSEEESKKRRSERIKQKMRKDNAKEADPPSSNDGKTKPRKPKPKLNKSAEDGAADTSDVISSGSSTSSNGPDDIMEDETEGELEDDNTNRSDDANITKTTPRLFVSEVTSETEPGDVYDLLKEYKKVCEMDYAWVDKQLRRHNKEPPKPKAIDLVQ